MKKKITVLIADDHQFIRESIRGMLEKTPFVKKIYEAENGQQAMDTLTTQSIDIALLDIRMPVADGFAVINFIEKTKLATRVVVLTAFDEEAMILNLMHANVPGIIFKRTTHQEEIYTALTTVLEGRQYYNEKVNVVLESNPTGIENPPRIKLSAREFDVLRCICQGMSSRAIAEKLMITEHTVEGYRKDILRKTNTKNTGELVNFAVLNGIIIS